MAKFKVGMEYVGKSGARHRLFDNSDNAAWPLTNEAFDRFWKVDGNAYNDPQWNVNCPAGDKLIEAVTAPKFKVGDRVRANTSSGGRSFLAGNVYTLIEVDGDRVRAVNEKGEPDGWSDEFFDRITPSPAIVCLIENGQPLPANRPHVHADRASAETEAARLACAKKGQEFGVYEMVATRKETKVYEHEWQRLAAAGKEGQAAVALRRLSGLPLTAAKDAVFFWRDAA